MVREARAMVAAGHGGVILNLSSSAVRGSPLGAHYSASKAGLKPCDGV